jgi:L-serine/L-threonine ammonia-lyase
MSRRPAGSPKPHFYISSAGNAGLACVNAARTLGCNVSVVVPTATPAMMRAKLIQKGATEVIVHGNAWADADGYLREHVLAADENGVYVPPFDHKDIWAGHASLVDELARQIPVETGSAVEPAAIVCSVGGGGLFCGIMQGVDNHGWSTNVIAVETAGADALGKSLECGEHIRLPAITSKAVSLGAYKVAEQAWQYASSRPEQVHSVIVSDGQAANACVHLANEERCMVELACGASVAALMDKNVVEKSMGRQLKEEDIIVLVVCGGSLITVETLREWESKYSAAKA